MPSNPTPNKGGCCAAGVVAMIFCAVLALWICYYKVPANKIGVRTHTSGGIEKHDFKPGFVLRVPGLHVVRLWDPTWTNVYRRMEVRGSDQYKTTVDVSVIYRIHPEKCHEIAGTFQDDQRIQLRVESSLSQYANEILTEMSTEDFYNPEIRTKKTEAMQKKMDDQLEPLGLEVKSVLLRNIVYDPNFEEQLLKKQIAGQTQTLEIAKSKQAVGETETELIEKQAQNQVASIKETLTQEMANLNAETDQKIGNIMQDAQRDAAAITAKAQADKRQALAEADRLKSEATAFGVAALSKVYARPGATFYFAQKSLQGLKLGNIELNSNTFNPLDIDKLLKALGLDLHAPGGVIQQK